MRDWLQNLPIPIMTVVVFAGSYLLAAVVYLGTMTLARGERAKSFKALSPGMPPPLGIIFGLLVGFIAAQVWSDFEKAKVAVSTEASALRAVNLLAAGLPDAQRERFESLIDKHVGIAVNHEWPAMARHRATLTVLPTALNEASQAAMDLTPADHGESAAQSEILRALETALDARRQRIVLSQSSVSTIKWTGILLQGLCALVAIAMVHSDNRLTCLIALGIFATGIALSVLLIAVYSQPFTGELSVGPELLKQVVDYPLPAGE
jgi:hypothetical protein